jgi:hypothetical protein
VEDIIMTDTRKAKGYTVVLITNQPEVSRFLQSYCGVTMRKISKGHWVSLDDLLDIESIKKRVAAKLRFVKAEGLGPEDPTHILWVMTNPEKPLR